MHDDSIAYCAYSYIIHINKMQAYYYCKGIRDLQCCTL